MQLFVTGGSGYLGGAVVERLVSAGHEVHALGRSETAIAKVEALGALAVPGSLGDLALLERSAGRADTVVHLAVDYFGDDARRIEEAALATMLKAGKPFVYSSTGQVYPDTGGRPVDETEPVDPATAMQPNKVLGERQVLDRGDSTVIRAGLVYGRGGTRLVQSMLAAARTNGYAPYVGDGSNHWGVIHVDDLSQLYRLAVEAPSPGVYNAASAEYPTMRSMVEAIAANAGVEARSITLADAVAVYGPFAYGLVRSTPMLTAKARSAYAWEATGVGLVDDVMRGSYLSTPTQP
jgi:nucleoside-diphosphate-sugar epimerase